MPVPILARSRALLLVRGSIEGGRAGIAFTRVVISATSLSTCFVAGLEDPLSGFWAVERRPLGVDETLVCRLPSAEDERHRDEAGRDDRPV